MRRTQDRGLGVVYLYSCDGLTGHVLKDKKSAEDLAEKISSAFIRERGPADVQGLCLGVQGVLGCLFAAGHPG